MIARISLLLILLICLPDVYLYYRSNKKGSSKKCKKIFFTNCLFSLAMVIFTIILSMERDFMPKETTFVEIYLLLLLLFIVPKFLYSLFSLIGQPFCKKGHRKINLGSMAALILTPIIWLIVIHGFFFGVRDVVVKNYDYISEDIPDAFDGYRILQWSDAHVGSYTGNRKQILIDCLDSIKKQHVDMIVFTGDLYNIRAEEILPFMNDLKSLKAKDGVYSILGNHDYSKYLNTNEKEKAENAQKAVDYERQLGWTLLLNENRIIRKGNDSIVLAGEENHGDGIHFPMRGDIKKTLQGISDSSFVIMLQHDPTAWRKHILPNCKAQLTLSGHTHGGQISLFGWTPISLTYDEWGGWYHEGDRTLFVSTGVGGVVPFRFNLEGEICVITLHKKK